MCAARFKLKPNGVNEKQRTAKNAKKVRKKRVKKRKMQTGKKEEKMHLIAAFHKINFQRDFQHVQEMTLTLILTNRYKLNNEKRFSAAKYS